MKRISGIVLAAALLFVVGCGDSHQKLMDDMVGAMEETTSILKGVKTEADAQAAKPKLEAVAARMKELEKRAKSLGEPSKEEAERMMKDNMAKMMKVGMELATETARIQGDPNLSKHLDKALGDVKSGM